MTQLAESVEVLPGRIRAKISLDDAGCWLWTAATDPDGYGRVGWEGRNRKAHRIVYQLLRGSLPAELDHTCRIRHCVNPAHLEDVSHAENVGRGDLGETLRRKFAAPRSCPQGHPMVGDNLLVQKTKAGHPNRKCRICARAAMARFKAKRAAAT